MIPDKWFIRTDKDNLLKVNKFYKDNIELYLHCDIKWDIYLDTDFYFPQPSKGMHSTKSLTYKDYKEISTEQFLSLIKSNNYYFY